MSRQVSHKSGPQTNSSLAGEIVWLQEFGTDIFMMCGESDAFSAMMSLLFRASTTEGYQCHLAVCDGDIISKICLKHAGFCVV